MTKKIYLETFKKCPGSAHFPLLQIYLYMKLHILKETRHSYFCVNPKDQALLEPALHFPG